MCRPVRLSISSDLDTAGKAPAPATAHPRTRWSIPNNGYRGRLEKTAEAH